MPRAGGVFFGQPGGPFQPEGYLYTLVNGGDTNVLWEGIATETWVKFDGPTGGSLAPRAAIALHVSIDPAAAALLPAGEHTASVRILRPDEPSYVAERGVTIELTASSGGWTTIVPSADTRQVFVSSSLGQNSNDGLSASTPKRSIAAGKALLRHGYPDWLLLNRGDTWHESVGQWVTSGRSATEPTVISSYGPSAERPRILSGTDNGIETHAGGTSPPTIDHVYVLGLEFFADAYTGAEDCKAVEWLQPSTDFLLEDCYCHGYSTNFVSQGASGRLSNIRVRRSVIADAYSTIPTYNSQGVYVSHTDGLLLEECVLDHNGWNETVPDAVANVFRHNAYIQNGNTGVVVSGNIFANASSHGLQLRCGGSVVDNLFLRNSIAMIVGAGNEPDPGGVMADVRANVILDGKDIDAGNPRGWGMVLADIVSGRAAFNLIANNSLGGDPVALDLQGNHVGDQGLGNGIHNLQVERNILFNWGGSLVVEGDDLQVTDVQLSRNDVQEVLHGGYLVDHFDPRNAASFDSTENRFFSSIAPPNAWMRIGSSSCSLDTWKQQIGDSTSVGVSVIYLEPDRSAASYNATLGDPGTFEAFMAAVRGQSQAGWRPELTARATNIFLRGGFSLIVE